MDEKCKLASELVDYIWYTHIYRKTLIPPHHTVEKTDSNGDRCDYYTEEAQDIFNKVLDIIDEVVELDGGV